MTSSEKSLRRALSVRTTADCLVCEEKDGAMMQRPLILDEIYCSSLLTLLADVLSTEFHSLRDEQDSLN